VRLRFALNVAALALFALGMAALDNGPLPGLDTYYYLQQALGVSSALVPPGGNSSILLPWWHFGLGSAIGFELAWQVTGLLLAVLAARGLAALCQLWGGGPLEAGAVFLLTIVSPITEWFVVEFQANLAGACCVIWFLHVLTREMEAPHRPERSAALMCLWVLSALAHVTALVICTVLLVLTVLMQLTRRREYAGNYAIGAIFAAGAAAFLVVHAGFGERAADEVKLSLGVAFQARALWKPCVAAGLMIAIVRYLLTLVREERMAPSQSAFGIVVAALVLVGWSLADFTGMGLSERLWLIGILLLPPAFASRARLRAGPGAYAGRVLAGAAFAWAVMICPEPAGRTPQFLAERAAVARDIHRLPNAVPPRSYILAEHGVDFQIEWLTGIQATCATDHWHTWPTHELRRRSAASTDTPLAVIGPFELVKR
jgi:hypothetical protein